MTHPLEERQTADGRRRLQLTNDERDSLAEQRLIERLISMFLDLDRKWTRAEMCDELDLTPKQLKRLTHTDAFKNLYAEHFEQLGHDPRLQAVQAGVTDLLPEAFDQLKKALSGADVPWTVKYKAIQDVFKLNGIKPVRAAQSDRKELAEFLRDTGLVVAENINVNVPDHYQDVVDDVVEGDVTEIEPTAIPDSVDPED